MLKFDNFSIVTDGKFVAIFVYPPYRDGKFYYGIYNHKYGAFNPIYPYEKYSYNAIAKDSDFRLANDDEIKQFCNDCKKLLGYEWDPVKHIFIDYPLNTKKDFLQNIKLPHYIPFYKAFENKKCIAQCIMYNYIYWAFNDGTYTRLRNTVHVYDDDNEELSVYDINHEYDIDENLNGKELLGNFDCNNEFDILDNDSVVTYERKDWWQLMLYISGCNFYISEYNTIENLFETLDNHKYSELGKFFIDNGFISIKDVKLLAKEYFDYETFSRLTTAIGNKMRIEKELKENQNMINEFDI